MEAKKTEASSWELDGVFAVAANHQDSLREAAFATSRIAKISESVVCVTFKEKLGVRLSLLSLRATALTPVLLLNIGCTPYPKTGTWTRSASKNTTSQKSKGHRHKP